MRHTALVRPARLDSPCSPHPGLPRDITDRAGHWRLRTRAASWSRSLLLAASLVLVGTLLPGRAAAQDSQHSDSEKGVLAARHLQEMQWREVGPYRGGRSAAVAGIPTQRQTYYFGATGGGVWKTEDRGVSWRNVSDGYFGGSIGAVAVSSWDPNVVYVGGGEKTVRGNVSHGHGVWKSTDAGKTWQHKGLSDSRHIPRLRIHPRNPDRVWAAVLGHLYGPSEERGVYRSDDGGESWQRVHFIGPEVGAVDLALDPTNPRILYAGFWRVRRTPWSLESGGEGSGLWKSSDGGDTWIDLSRNPGLPQGTLGIVGVSVSASDPQNLYTIIEAEEGGVFRSRDGGETWERTNSQRDLRQRAWYYTRIVADPVDAESVYVLNVRFHHSKDGGRTFRQIPTPHGDNHDLWIDPRDPKRMIEANDGGANVSEDGGSTWSRQDNQPTAQMYRVSTDDAFPYRLLGGQQDNSAIRIRSRSAFGNAIGQRDWEPTAGGESGHIVAQPGNPDVVFGGSYGGTLVRVDHRTGERRVVNVWPDDPMGWGASDLKYRFQWNFPIFFSPHDPEMLYAAANVLFASGDQGQSWQVLSPDLTRNDHSKMGPSGGPITKDNTSVEYYGTIFAAAESAQEPGLLWTGSDDGLVHISRDGGETWSNVTPEQLPEWSQINGLEVDPHRKGGLYLAATRYKLDDFEPYLFATTDYGQTWRRLDQGIPRLQFTRALRVDQRRQGLLYAGTEEGVWTSLDDGQSWHSLQLNLPVVPITDLAVKEGDLVAATQGRGYWILDDLSPLQQLDQAWLQPDAQRPALHLGTPRPTYVLRGGSSAQPGTRGRNPPDGVILDYWLGADLEEPAADEELASSEDRNTSTDSEEAETGTAQPENSASGDEPDEEKGPRLEILDSQGQVLRTFIRKAETGDEEEESSSEEANDPSAPSRVLATTAGHHRITWDLRHPGPETFPGLVIWNRIRTGPRVSPGQYRARFTLGEHISEVPFELLRDPRLSSSDTELQQLERFQLELRDLVSEVHRGIRQLRTARSGLKALEGKLAKADDGEQLQREIEAAKEELDNVEQALYQTQNRSPQDPLNFPIRLNDKLSGLLRRAMGHDGPPTHQMVAVREELESQATEQLQRLEQLWTGSLPRINSLAAELAIPAIDLDLDKGE